MAFPEDRPAPDQVRGGPDKHEQARRLAEAALRAEREGNDAEAERLFEQAERTDPEALVNALQERDGAPAGDLARGPSTDEEVAAITETVEPHADAPSRAGISGAGSGADNERR